MKTGNVMINRDDLPACLAVLIEKLEPADLPRLELAFRGLSGLHAVFSQMLGANSPAPAVPASPGEPSDLERLVATLMARMGQQEEIVGRMADEIAGLHALATGMAERVAAQSELLSRRASKDDAIHPNDPRIVHDEPIGPTTLVPDSEPAPPAPAYRVESGAATVEPVESSSWEPPPAAAPPAPEPGPQPGADAAPEVRAPAPADAGASSGGGLHPTSARRRERRLDIARLLAAGGPLSCAAICGRLGIPTGTINSLLSCDWFEKTGGDRFAPYGLTGAGRDALREAGYVVGPAEPRTGSPAPEVPPSRDAATGASAKAERNRQQCVVIAEAMLEAGHGMTQRGISNAAGLPEEVVQKHLAKHGPAAFTHGQMRYFLKDGDLWTLTDAGKALAAPAGGGKAVGS